MKTTLDFLEDICDIKSWTDVYDFVEVYFGAVPVWIADKAEAEETGITWNN